MARILVQRINNMNNWAQTALTSLINTWVNFWFQDKNTVPLDVMRIGLGFLMFFNYGLYDPADIVTLYGEAGLFSQDVVPEMSQFYSFSLFLFCEESWQLLTLHYTFVFLFLLFCIGWKMSWIKWIVFIAHLSYMNRNPFASYGVDAVLVTLLFLLCIAPIGSALSLDRLVRIKKYRVKNGSEEGLALPTSQIGFACQRLLQFQMVVIYFSSGTEKLQGKMWWAGEAPWYAMVNYSTAFFPVGLFAEHFWLVNLMAYGTLLIEISYAFLIWGIKTRPYLLAAALFLHFAIAILLGMYFFAAVMTVGHLVFMRRVWYLQGERWLCKRFNAIRNRPHILSQQ